MISLSVFSAASLVVAVVIVAVAAAVAVVPFAVVVAVAAAIANGVGLISRFRDPAFRDSVEMEGKRPNAICTKFPSLPTRLEEE